MRNTRFCRLLTTVLCLSLCAGSMVRSIPAYAIDSSYEELETLNDSKEKLEAQVTALNNELASLALEQQELNDKIVAKEAEIEQTTEDLEEAQLREQEQLEAMRLRIKFTYENSGDGFITMLFGAKNMADFISRTEQIELFSTYDHNMLMALIETKVEIAAAKTTLENERAEMDELQAELLAKQEEFNKKIVECQSSISEYDEQIAEVQEKIRAYEERQKQQVAAVIDNSDNTTQYQTNNGATTANASEYQLLAAIIYCEAGNQPQTGKIAVGSVVLNRMRSSRFPGDITSVIYQNGQFAPTWDGALARALATGSYSSCFSAADAALAGEDPTGGCLFFRTNNGRPGIVIGDHVFY